MTMRTHAAVLGTAMLCLAAAGSVRAEAPETVMITLHAKAGAEAELAQVIARHWDTVQRLKLATDAPHVTLRGAEEGTSTYFVEIFTWRDASIPDAAPKEIQAIWADMSRLVEKRNGKPGLTISEVSLVAK
jgi:hypothetical protein